MIHLKGGYLVDPVNHLDGPGDLWIEGGRIVAPPAGGRATETVDCTGCVVMAGAIDVHSHIGGGNVNTARLLLPEGIRHRCDGRAKRRCRASASMSIPPVGSMPRWGSPPSSNRQ